MKYYGSYKQSTSVQKDHDAIMAMYQAPPRAHIVVEQKLHADRKTRSVLDSLTNKLKPGDALYVHSIDQLGLDAYDIVKTWREITERLHAEIIVLNDPALDTRAYPDIAPGQVWQAAQSAVLQKTNADRGDSMFKGVIAMACAIH